MTAVDLPPAGVAHVLIEDPADRDREAYGANLALAVVVAATCFIAGTAVGFGVGWFASPNQRHNLAEVCAAYPPDRFPRPAEWTFTASNGSVSTGTCA